MVIADSRAKQIRIYSIEGEHKRSINSYHGLPSQPWQVVINSESEDNFFVTGSRAQIQMYELGGKSTGHWVSCCPQATSNSPNLFGLAIDHTGNVLVGECRHNYINKHRQDGSYLGSIKIGIEPRYIAVTSQDTMVIAGWGKAPQIVSNTGQVLHTLKHPVRESQWNPMGVYCHEDIIYVANLTTRNILCYKASGKYLGAISIPPVYPTGGLAMTPDYKTLLVCEGISVKVFSLSIKK